MPGTFRQFNVIKQCMAVAIVALLLTGCHSRSIPPVSQIALRERSLQSDIMPGGIWTLSFDHRFQPQTSPDGTGTLWMDSTLTLHNPGIKRVRITMHFVDADGKVLGSTRLLNLSSFPTNPVLTNHQFSTPAGTVAIGWQASTSGWKPVD